MSTAAGQREEAAFLSAIAESPEDFVLRQVYADWLEERGDPRSQLVRLEEAARQLGVCDDAYWDRPKRRRHLVNHAGGEWLGRMGYHTVRSWAPVLAHGWPEGVKQRFRLVRAFLEIWNGIELPDAGEEPRPDYLEPQLLAVVPPAVREWVALLPHWPRPLGPLRTWNARPYFLPTAAPMEGHDALTLLEEDNGNGLWAVRARDWHGEDPPVHRYELYHCGVRHRVIESTSQLAWLLAVRSTPAQYQFGVQARVWQRSEDVLHDDFPFHLAWDGTQYFETRELLVMVEGPRRRFPLVTVRCWREMREEELPPSLQMLIEASARPIPPRRRR